jgi:gamma-glutamyl-gamma-aminobutyrate hydrolase PuuD
LYYLSRPRQQNFKAALYFLQLFRIAALSMMPIVVLCRAVKLLNIAPAIEFSLELSTSITVTILTLLFVTPKVILFVACLT